MSKLSELLTCQQVLSITFLIGFMIHHMLRVNISIAIVEMTVNNESNSSYSNLGPRYSWSQEEKNNVLGYFFFGYVLTQVPGGRMSEKLGAKVVIGTGLLLASFLTLLAPLFAQLGYNWLAFSRFCLGAAMGIHWPSAPPIAAQWIPPTDSAKFMSHTVASSLGVALTLPICGYLIAYKGWPSVFYVTGFVALIWTICWWILIYDSPEQHPRISKKEKDKLLQKLVRNEVKKDVPWKKIFKSGAVWAIIVGNTCGSYTFFVAFNQLPSYMSQVLLFDIKANGWFCSLPYLVRYVTAVVSAIVADKIIKSGKLSTRTVRKLFSVTFFVGNCCLFTIQCFWGYSRIVSVVVFTGSLGLMGFLTPGVYTNPIDIAPAYSGTILGISQVPAALTGYITTKVSTLLIRDKNDFQQWTYAFWIMVAVNFFAAIFTFVFTSGERQRWNDAEEADEEKEMITIGR